MTTQSIAVAPALEANVAQDSLIRKLLGDDEGVKIAARELQVSVRHVRELFHEAALRYDGIQPTESIEMFSKEIGTLVREAGVVEELAVHYVVRDKEMAEALETLRIVATSEPAVAIDLRDRTLRKESLAIQTQLDQLSERQEAIKEYFRAKPLVDGETTDYDLDEGGIRLTPSRKFTEQKAREILSKDELKIITVEKLDPTLARRALPQDRYEACREDGTTSVAIY